MRVHSRGRLVVLLLVAPSVECRERTRRRPSSPTQTRGQVRLGPRLESLDTPVGRPPRPRLRRRGLDEWSTYTYGVSSVTGSLHVVGSPS